MIFGWIAFVLFWIGWGVGSFEQLLYPAKTKAKELRFFRNRSIVGLHDWLLFALFIVCVFFFVLHILFETMLWHHALTYVFILLYAVLFSLFFVQRFADFMYERVARHSVHDFVVNGVARLIVLVFMVASSLFGSLLVEVLF